MTCSLPLPPISCPVRHTPSRASRALKPLTAAFTAHTVRRRHHDLRLLSPPQWLKTSLISDTHKAAPPSVAFFTIAVSGWGTGRGTSLEAFVISQSVSFCCFCCCCCCCPASALFVLEILESQFLRVQFMQKLIFLQSSFPLFFLFLP